MDLALRVEDPDVSSQLKGMVFIGPGPGRSMVA